MRTALASPEVWCTMTRKFEVGAWLSTGWDTHGDRAVNGFNVDIGAENGINHWDSNFGKNKITFARKSFVCLNANFNIKVATLATFLWGRAALAAQTNALTIINTSWNFELNVFTINCNVLGAAKNGFFEINRSRSAHIATTTSAAETATKAKHRAKDIVEATATKIEIERLTIEIIGAARKWITTS